MRVSYNGITSAFQADDRGSIPLTRSVEYNSSPLAKLRKIGYLISNKSRTNLGTDFL